MSSPQLPFQFHYLEGKNYLHKSYQFLLYNIIKELFILALSDPNIFQDTFFLISAIAVLPSETEDYLS